MAHSSLRNNPKLKKLARLLGVPEPHAIGLLECFWWTVYDCRSVGEDGALPRSWGAADVAASAGWDANPKLFVLCLRRAGFINCGTKPWVVHHYSDWAPDYVRKRWSRQKLRESGETLGDRTTAENGGKRRKTAENGGTTRTRPDPTKPNPTQPRSDSKDHAKGSRAPPMPQPETGSIGSVLNRMGPIGSDRSANDRFRSLFVAGLCEAFGILNDGPALRKQERPFKAIARRILAYPERDRLAKSLVALARTKHDAGLDNPPAAWQKEVNEILTEKGI